jgi:pimeloyl-ACP methyl ester carboxylesterase
VSTLWLANSMRTQGVGDELLQNTGAVSVVESPAVLEFLPVASDRRTGLVFFCGSGVSAHAYAPLLRPIADAGYPVFIVKLPYRFAPFEGHKQEAIQRARALIANHREVQRWAIAGHSLGGALAARMAQTDGGSIAALILIGTTHPKETDLSSLQMPVTKIYATNDGVAPADRVLSNKHLLPSGTKWVRIDGGNHSQFGHYGHQLFDGTASISRDAQQAAVRSELLASLAAAS